MANYHKVLSNETRNATPAIGAEAELNEALCQINEALKGPMPNFERICLAAERSSIRKALEAALAAISGSADNPR